VNGILTYTYDDSTADSAFYCGLEKIPDLPHLFVVPGSLVAQVCHEHQVFFKAHSIDILAYNGTVKQRAEFWSDRGPYRASKHKPRHRIMIASHSVSNRVEHPPYPSTNARIEALAADAQLAFDIPLHHKKYRKKPWVGPEKKLTAPPSIFDLEFLNVCIDEAHQMRNMNAKYWAVLGIRDRGTILIPTTATPLHTAPKVR
jgi:SNF2-related domain